MYVQLQRHVRKMAGDQKLLQRWLYAGGVCASTTLIMSILLCFGLMQRCWGWLFPSLTPKDLENMDIATALFYIASLLAFWTLALYARLRSDIRRPELKVCGSLANSHQTHYFADSCQEHTQYLLRIHMAVLRLDGFFGIDRDPARLACQC